MIGKGRPSFPFTKASITANAPKASGVYAILNAQKWIYVGESGDLQASLLGHYAGDNRCIVLHRPTAFQVEPCNAQQRVVIQDALVLQLKMPECNKTLLD